MGLPPRHQEDADLSPSRAAPNGLSQMPPTDTSGNQSARMHHAPQIIGERCRKRFLHNALRLVVPLQSHTQRRNGVQPLHLYALARVVVGTRISPPVPAGLRIQWRKACAGLWIQHDHIGNPRPAVRAPAANASPTLSTF